MLTDDRLSSSLFVVVVVQYANDPLVDRVLVVYSLLRLYRPRCLYLFVSVSRTSALMFSLACSVVEFLDRIARYF